MKNKKERKKEDPNEIKPEIWYKSDCTEFGRVTKIKETKNSGDVPKF